MIVYPDKEPGRLRDLSDSEINNLRARALHNVLSEHTYRHRWESILRSIGYSHQVRRNTITIVSWAHCRTDALAAISWFQQYAARLPGARLLLIAGPELNGIETAQIYREFNRYGVTVTAYSYARRYAMLDKYRPIETSHFVTINPHAPPPQDWLSHAFLHLSYMNDHALAPAPSHEQKYRIIFTDTPENIMDVRHRFGLWLEASKMQRHIYFL